MSDFDLRSLRRRFRARGMSRNRPSQPAHSDLDLGQIISPLRLDVMVRASLFERWWQDWDVLASQPEQAIAVAQRHPYRIWFDSVALTKIAGNVAGTVSADDAFRWRARRSHSLLNRYVQSGFDERFPITVRTHQGGTLSSDKVMASRHYPVDGCHRLALLWLDGVRTLTPSHYRIVTTSMAPRDNTSRLLRDLSMSERDYARFLGWGYGVDDATSVEDVCQFVEQDPTANAELRSVITVDGQSKTDNDEVTG